MVVTAACCDGLPPAHAPFFCLLLLRRCFCKAAYACPSCCSICLPTRLAGYSGVLQASPGIPLRKDLSLVIGIKHQVGWCMVSSRMMFWPHNWCPCALAAVGSVGIPPGRMPSEPSMFCVSLVCLCLFACLELATSGTARSVQGRACLPVGLSVCQNTYATAHWHIYIVTLLAQTGVDTGGSSAVLVTVSSRPTGGWCTAATQ